MDMAEIAAQRPQNIADALRCMREALNYFHERNDNRAIFLRLYYIMTLEVHAAIKQLHDYQNTQVFLDPAWIERLSGLFASMYFQSLDNFERDPESDVSRAWKVAHQAAKDDNSTVVECALLGIVAHIMYDLPRAVAMNLREHGDTVDYLTLQARKFDHDQVNNLLVRSLGYIQSVLARDYERGISLVDGALGQLDEKVSKMGLTRYRERVWWDAIAFVSASNDQRQEIVREKLNWESHRLAKNLSGSLLRWWVWLPERIIAIPWRLFGKKRYDTIVLEGEGGVAAARAKVTVDATAGAPMVDSGTAARG